jgi:hypothetical protein
MPVYVDRFGSVIWYTVEVVRDTTLVRASGFRAPMWEVLATGDSVAPTARLWVSQRHRFVDRALLTEPGASMTYTRGVTQDMSATEQSRTRPSMMRRANSRQPVMAAS